MKGLYIALAGIVLIFTSCTKEVLVSQDPTEFMRTHDRGSVAYIDYHTGNYIMETRNGYSVMEAWGTITPFVGDRQYGYFSNRGVQTIYNYTGNYFTQDRVVDSWLTWSEALYVLDHIGYTPEW